MKRLLSATLLAALCGVLVLLSGCRSASSSEGTRTGFALDTVISITVYEAEDTVDTETVLDECFAEIERVENLFSVNVPQSDISRINAADGAPVQVAAETAELLRLCLRYGDISQGAFDVTLRPVTVLWDFSADPPSLPNEDQLKDAVSTVDYRHLTVTGTTVTLTEGALDLGGRGNG